MSADHGGDPAGYREHRFAVRLLAFLDAEVPTLPPDSPLRAAMNRVGATVAQAHGYAEVGQASPLGSLLEAQAELLARLAEVDGQPFVLLTPEQWETVGAGIQWTQDEIEEASAATARRFLPLHNARPPIVIASAYTAAGIVLGGLAAHWRR